MFGVHGIRFKIGKWMNKAEPQEEKPKVHHPAHHPAANSHSVSLKKEAPPVLARHSVGEGLGVGLGRQG